MGGEEAIVYRWDGCQESDWFFRFCFWKEWGSQSLPDCIDIERKHKFDGGAGEKWCQKGIDGTMNVMEREDVEEMVFWCVFPGFV